MLLADVDVTRSIQGGLNELIAFVPELIAAIVILVVGYFVAKFVANLIGRLTARAGLDRALLHGQGGTWVQRVTSSPSRLVARIAFWALFLGVISFAVSVLGISALSSFVGAIFAYLPNVIAALAIFLVAGAVAAGVATLASRLLGDTALGKIVGVAAPILVMTIATFMILDQLKIAESIVTITYAGLIGAIALGSALAFGLGGRDVAARMLEGAYAKGQERKEEFRRDLDQGMRRGQEELDRQKQTADASRTTGATTRPARDAP
ncbi:MAG: hypothetical protein M3321_05015 [Actinomycetota bacterium]|nr:hypothetical protein [Actinomycetota bacterium]